MGHHRHRRHRTGDQDVASKGEETLRVAVVDRDGAVVVRLRAAARVEVVAHLDAATPELATTLPGDLDVAVVAVRDADPGTVQDLRRLHRVRPGVRLVAIGDGTHHFEDAFDAGADAWIAADADDHTLRAALHGTCP
ncbi:hypothetical protein FTX61_03835 [Nitriliruptoraceae bacterium ZYF776]|nr:hypothetical protein [Profundirhabdus halotolerans]